MMIKLAQYKLAEFSPKLLFAAKRRNHQRLPQKEKFENIATKKRIRNIGILAHIDAGKTTTTERMLFYSGKIRHMGEVHDGNTTTDYMEQERNRGITITSASVTVPWMNHRINIIDTPGHIDFTLEVEQSLKIIDGAVIILDGSAGVEAQTVTVWRQADRYNVPRLVYVNKMDRLDASFDICIKMLRNKFPCMTPLPIQIPIPSKNTGISAIADVITREVLTWHGESGDKVCRKALNENEDAELWAKVRACRNELVDKLAVLDDPLMASVMKGESLENISVGEIYDALHRVTLSLDGFAVLCGSSYKNVGVQKLLDAVVNVLPSADDRSDLRIYDQLFGEIVSAKAFKVVHDKQRGPITFLRIYTGSLKAGQKVYNVREQKQEQIQRVMLAYADDYEIVAEMPAGNIAAVTGLKLTNTDDFMVGSVHSEKRAIKMYCQMQNLKEEDGKAALFSGYKFSDPVFFCCIEPPSLSAQSALDTALNELRREDPGLSVQNDKETGQTILGGMGELHMEIIKERIRSDYKIDAYTGPLQIAYKEFVMGNACETVITNVVIGGSKHFVTLKMSIFPKSKGSGELVTLDKTRENAANTSSININLLNHITEGIELALLKGPKVSCPVVNAGFMIHWFESGKRTASSIITSTAAQCVQKLLEKAGTLLMEPIMSMEIVTDDVKLTTVMGDISKRRSAIKEITTRGDNKVVRTLTPLSELLGYASALRIMTSGSAHFTMELHSYKELCGGDEARAIQNITGFYPNK